MGRFKPGGRTGEDGYPFSLAFSLGLFVGAVLICFGIVAPPEWGRQREMPRQRELQSYLKKAVRVEADCEWVQVLVSSNPAISWTPSMSKYCGTEGLVIGINGDQGLVKLQHGKAVLAWPIYATTIASKRPPHGFLTSRLKRASFYVDRLEKELSGNSEQLRRLLSRLSLSRYFSAMKEDGLSTLELISSGTDSDRQAIGMEVVDWGRVKIEAQRMLAEGDGSATKRASLPPAVPVAPLTPIRTASPEPEPEQETAPTPKPETTPKTQIPNEEQEDDKPSKEEDKEVKSEAKTSDVTENTKVDAPNPINVKQALFIHLPKAGGTAITAALRSMVGCSVEPCQGWESEHPPCKALQGCFGHDPLKNAHLSSKAKGELDLMVVNTRNPVDRIVSAFHHGSREWPCCGLTIRSEFKDRLYRASGKPNAFTMKTFAEELSVRNCMTKMMIGKECKAKLELNDQMYEKAVANLQKFDVVMIQEFMQESLNLLSCVSGKELEHPSVSKKIRAGVYSDKGSLEVREAIKKANNYDVALHEKSIAHFCTLYKRHQCSFKMPPDLCKADEESE